MYTLNQIEAINIDNFKLCDDILSNIEELENIHGERKEANIKKKLWNQPKKFQKTVIIQNTSEEDLIFNNIRNALNKISENNYESQLEIIMLNIDKCDGIDKVVQRIYTIACNNKIFSELYAKIYNTLNKKNPLFGNEVFKMIENYKTVMKKIKYIDPNEDYDNYCMYTKNNDMMRASLLFYIHLFKYCLLKREQIIDIILFIIEEIKTSYTVENKTNENEELVEHLHILCKNMNIKMSDKYEQIFLEIEHLSKAKKDQTYISISSRINFRCMDIIKNLSSM